MTGSNALAAAGPQAAAIGQLWWLTLWLCVFVFIVMMAALAWALWRSRGGSVISPATAGDARVERDATAAVGMAVVLSSILLAGLLAASVTTDRALASLPLADALAIRVTAHQWWWEVFYDDAQPAAGRPT